MHQLMQRLGFYPPYRKKKMETYAQFNSTKHAKSKAIKEECGLTIDHLLGIKLSFGKAARRKGEHKYWLLTV
jgi:hypothetical protein